MSLILSYSGIETKTQMNFGEDGIKTVGMRVGDYYISNSDFCDLIDYYFTNSDLDKEDERLKLLHRIKNSKIIEGYNKGNKRIDF